MKFETIANSFILLTVLIMGLSGVFGIINGYRQMHAMSGIVMKENNLDKSIKDLHYLGKCLDDVLGYSLFVSTAPSLDTVPDSKVEGEFYSDYMGIVLVDTSIKTIAHEVSHATDRIVYLKGITDGETRAYIQGALTACVQQIIETDQSQSRCTPGIHTYVNSDFLLL